MELELLQREQEEEHEEEQEEEDGVDDDEGEGGGDDEEDALCSNNQDFLHFLDSAQCPGPGRGVQLRPSAGLTAPSVDVNCVPVWTFIPAGAVSPRLLRVLAVPLVLPPSSLPPPSSSACRLIPAFTASHRMNK